MSSAEQWRPPSDGASAIIEEMRLGTALGVVALMLTVSAAIPANAGSSPTVPKGWKLVTHRGVGIDVPSTWTVKPWHGNCGTATPTVLLGPEGLSAMGCQFVRAFHSGAAQVMLGARQNFRERPLACHAAQRTPCKKDVEKGIHQVIRVTQQWPSSPHRGSLLDLHISVRLASKGMTISIMAGTSAASPGGAPRRATVNRLHTIHSVGG